MACSDLYLTGRAEHDAVVRYPWAAARPATLSSTARESGCSMEHVWTCVGARRRCRRQSEKVTSCRAACRSHSWWHSTGTADSSRRKSNKEKLGGIQSVQMDA